MKLKELELPGVFLIENFQNQDVRGVFVKTFNRNLFEKHNIKDLNFREMYYSVSHQNTIRGMHFQLPPHAHAKLIYLTSGSALDVLVDLREEKGNYGKVITILLETHKHALYIPAGIAHGFKALEDDTVIIYNQTQEYNRDNDTGINYRSINYNWGTDEPIVSERDKNLPKLSEFKTPFQK